MPDRDLVFGVRLTADGNGLVGEVRLSRAELEKLDRVTRRSGRAARDHGRAQREAARATGRATRANRDHARSQALVARGYAAIRAALPIAGFAGLAAASLRAVTATVRVADANVALRNRLALVTETEAELADVRGRLIQISRDTRSDLAQDAALYQRLALSTSEAVFSEERRLGLLRTLNQLVRIGGSDAAASSAALNQLFQSFSSGTFRGEEFNAVWEQAPGIQRAIIDGFEEMAAAGELSFVVTRENIRGLAEEGVLGADLLARAIETMADRTEEEFGGLATTISEEFGLIRREFRLLLDDFEGATGAFGRFGRGLGRLRATLFGGAAAVAPGGALETNQRLFDLVQAGYRDVDVVRAGRAGLEARREDLAGGVLRGEAIGSFSDDELRAIAGRGSTETGASAARTLAQALGGHIQAQFRSGFTALVDETERQFAAESQAAIRELDLRASAQGSPARQAFLQETAAAEAEQARQEAESRRADEVKRTLSEFAQLEASLLGPARAIEASYEKRVALLEAHRPGNALLRELLETERELELARLGLSEAEEEAARLASERAEQEEEEIERYEAMIDGLERVAEAREAAAAAAPPEAALGGFDFTGLFALPDPPPPEETRAKWGRSLAPIAQAFAGLAGAAATGSRSAARQQKRLAIAAATASTYQAANAALATPPGPPATIPLAIAAVATGLANVAQIRASRFARGGVIEGRREFAFGGGELGVAGEAGPEVILPLRRGPSGDLGVSATALGDRVFAPRIEIAIHVGGAGSGVESTAMAERLGSELGGKVERRLRPLFTRWLEEERRGGVLSPEVF